jgi:short subunit dehydrogenase-like uncharacterized protein
MTIAIAWGDLATAYVSTGIPNIETYASMPPAAAIASRALNWAHSPRHPYNICWSGSRIAARALRGELRTGRSLFWGEVRNSTGERRTAGWRPPMATA